MHIKYTVKSYFSLTVSSGNSGSGIADEGTTQPSQVTDSTTTNAVTTGTKATENETNGASVRESQAGLMIFPLFLVPICLVEM